MYNRGKPIPDEGLEKCKYAFTKQAIGFDQIDIHKKYCETFRKWIQGTQLNTITGLDDFTTTAFSMGTTESFDKFYIRVDILERFFIKIIEGSKNGIFKVDSNMINLIGCSKENFFKLLELMDYRAKKSANDKQEFFTYKPKLIKNKIIKKIRNTNINNPFKKLAQIQFK